MIFLWICNFGSLSFSQKKTKRRFLPNLQTRNVYVPELGRKVRIKMSARAIRTMDKKGGLMNYLRDQGMTIKDVT